MGLWGEALPTEGWALSAVGYGATQGESVQEGPILDGKSKREKLKVRPVPLC